MVVLDQEIACDDDEAELAGQRILQADGLSYNSLAAL
jgi:hypothetical protein